jgi:outer membrane lipoprotein-sorting protein
MSKLKTSKSVSPLRAALVLAAALMLSGCWLIKTKSRVSVPQPLSPLVEADITKMFEEINRLAAVQALNGRVDVQFLDNSFAECGIVEKYKTVDGRIVVQRPGKIYLLIQAPIIGTKIAEMSSNGQRFWAAVYQGDEKYKRFVTGTNSAAYEKLDADGRGASNDCAGSGKKREEAMQRATVSALSSLRPQHFTDALLVPPVAPDDPGHIYAVTETFEEEADQRPGAAKGARVIRGYYLLTEFESLQGNRARVTRRFWFDRVGQFRLARVQTYDERGRLVTDVVYGYQQPFGADGSQRLPTRVELTRQQDHYSISVTFQDPGAVKVNQPLPDDAFVLKNTSGLKEVDLDAKKK